MKTTKAGVLYEPTSPCFPKIEISPISNNELLETVSEEKNLFISLDFSTRQGFSFFNDVIKMLESPLESINFEEIFQKMQSGLEELSSNQNLLQSETLHFGYAIQKIYSLFSSIPVENLHLLINCLINFVENFGKPEFVPHKPSTTPMKSPRPITIIPKVGRPDIKCARIVAPRISARPSVVLRPSTNSILPPLEHNDTTHSTSCYVSPFACVLVAKACEAIGRGLSDNEINFLIQHLCLLKDDNYTINMKTYIASALCRIAAIDPSAKSKISKSSNCVKFALSYLSTQHDKLDINLLTQLICLLSITSYDEIDESIAVAFIGILRVYPTYHKIVLNICNFFSRTCQDAGVRNAFLSEFDSSVILTLLLELISIYKKDEAIATRICFIISVLFENEFDIQSVSCEVTDPLSIAVALEIIPGLTSKRIATSVILLLACFAKNKACIPILRNNFASLFKSTDTLLDTNVAILAINLSRLFVEQGENLKLPEMFSCVEEWVSLNNEEVTEGALSLMYELSQYIKIPTSIVKALLKFIGDDNQKISFLAIHVLAASSSDDSLLEFGSIIDTNIKKAISVEELDEGTVKELANIFMSPLKSVFTDDTLDDARAFDDLAIATV